MKTLNRMHFIRRVSSRVVVLCMLANRRDKSKSLGIVQFLLEHSNHSYRGRVICQQL